MTVEVENLTVRYGERVAVDRVTCTFPSGACGLLGRNGAGKSSILKALLGLVQPSGGRMRLFEADEGLSPLELRSRIGYMPENDAYLPGATGFEMVSLLGMLSGMPERDAWRRAHEVLYLVGLEDQRYRQVGTFSRGMRQKVKLAAALVHDPEVLFLDEPTNGLDPAGRLEMLRLVGDLGRDLGKSIVLSTHILQDVEAICDEVVVLDAGRVAVHGPIEALTRGRGRLFSFVVEPADLVLPGRLGEQVELERDDDGVYRARLPEGVTTREVFEAVRASGGFVRRLGPVRRTLEDVFFELVGEGEDAR